MTYGGYGGGPSDPFGSDPFGAPPPSHHAHPSVGGGHPGNFGYPPQSPAPHGEPNTLATLSIVFAVVFAPAGAALGHVALHQIRHREQRGRDRAVVGLALSYLIMLLAIVALVIWLLAADPPETPVAATPLTSTNTTRPIPAPPPPPRTTVINPPPVERPTVQVEELHIGDCVEFTQEEPFPGQPDKDVILIYRSACEVRDGVVQVSQIAGSQSGCPGYALFNKAQTIFACVSDYRYR